MKRIIAVGGGKGGVGKSLVSANMAVAAAQFDYNVVLVDADLGGANLHTILGIQHPKFLLEHFISHKISALEEAIVETSQPKLKLICGGMPIPGSANPNYAQKNRLIKHIMQLEADVVILDIGSGVAYNELDLFNSANIKVAVFTPQLTSLHNGYGFIKSAILRELQKKIPANLRKHLESAGPEAGGETIAEINDRIAQVDQSAAEQTKAALNEYDVYMVGNMLRSPSENTVLASIGNVIRHHLQIKAPIIGALRYSDKLQKSVNERRPFMLNAGIDPLAELFRVMTAGLLALPLTGSSSVPPMDGLDDDLETEEIAPATNNTRYPVNWRVVVQRASQKVVGRMLNIASGGALIELPEVLEPVTLNTPTYLSVIPPDSDIEATLKIEERHRNDSTNQYGFSFCDLTESANDMINRLLTKAISNTAAHP